MIGDVSLPLASVRLTRGLVTGLVGLSDVDAEDTLAPAI